MYGANVLVVHTDLDTDQIQIRYAPWYVLVQIFFGSWQQQFWDAKISNSIVGYHSPSKGTWDLKKDWLLAMVGITVVEWALFG
jgi:hypothetical protein